MKTTTTVLCGLLFTSMAMADERSFGDGVLPEPLQIYDLNHDGVLDSEEAQAMKLTRRNRHEEHQSRWDTDGDGLLSEAERTAARAALRAQVEENRNARFAEVDTNGNGALDRDEFGAIPALGRLGARHPERVDALFNHLDRNDDGVITLDEFKARLGVGRPGPGDVPGPGEGEGDGGAGIRG